jgi:hypothetical protein
MKKLLISIFVVCLGFSLYALGACATPGTTDPPPSTAVNYTVRFLDYDDAVLKTQEVEEGGAATAPANPSRIGYDFTGWSAAFDNITADLDVKALYTEKQVPVGDTTAPVISFKNITGTRHTIDNVDASEEILLPAAKAVDETDGDLTESIIVRLGGTGAKLEKNGVTADGVVYKFKSTFKGMFSVLYVAFDQAENQSQIAEIIIKVYATGAPETEIPEEENRVSNLANSGVAFKENFDKGPENALIGSAFDVAKHAYHSDASAIAGTSFLMGFGQSYVDKVTWIGSMSSYANRFGTYKVKFDIKLVSGTADDNLYVSLRPDGNTGAFFSIDKRIELTYLLEGSGSNVTTYEDYLVYHPLSGRSEQPLYLAFFWTGNPVGEDVVLAFDNFEITYYSNEDAVTAAEELLPMKSVTYDHTDNRMYIPYSEAVNKPSSLSGQDGFSDNVIEITSYGAMLRLANTSALFVPGKTYRISFNYYIADSASATLYIGISGAANSFNWQAMQSGTGEVREFSVTFTAQSGDRLVGEEVQSLNFYSAGKAIHLYVGDITIENLYAADDLIADGGRTWDNVNLLMDVDNSTIIDIPDILKGGNGDPLEGFSSKVLHVNPEGEEGLEFLFRHSAGLFKAGRTYKISFTYYTINQKNGFLFVGFNVAGGSGVATTVFPELLAGIGVHQYTAIFTAKEADSLFGIYTNIFGTHLYEGYIGDFVVTPIYSAGDLITAGSRTWNHSGDDNLDVTNGAVIAAPDAVKSEGELHEGFSEEVLHLVTTNEEFLFSFNGTNTLFMPGAKYTIAFSYYIVNAPDGYLFTGFQYGMGFVLGELSSAVGLHTYTATFTAQAGDDKFAIYTQGHLLECYIGDFTITVYSFENDPGLDVTYSTDTNSWDQVNKVLEINDTKIVERPDYLEEEEGFSEQVIYLSTTGREFLFTFSGTNGKFTAGKTYTITFDYYILNAPDGFLYTGFQYGMGFEVLPMLNSAAGVHTYSETFVAQQDDNAFAVYTAGRPLQCIIGNLTITEAD